MNIDPRYPIGQYEPQPYSEKQLQAWLTDIRFLPGHLENAILNLDEAQLDTPYREGGWTVKQLIHHVADSHMNSFIRFKLALTENEPTIKPYEEQLWAELPDVSEVPINTSLTLLHALHARWIVLLQSLQEADWQKTLKHPAHEKPLTLWFMLGLYAWHSRHHTAHITTLREQKKW